MRSNQDSRSASRRNVGLAGAKINLGSLGLSVGDSSKQRFSALQPGLVASAVQFLQQEIKAGHLDPEQRPDEDENSQIFYECDHYEEEEFDEPLISMKESVHVSTPDKVCEFVLRVLHEGAFSVAELVICIIYLRNFRQSTQVIFRPCTWRPLFVTALLLADKMWQDKPMLLGSMRKLFPIVTNAELTKLESVFVDTLDFRLFVTPEEFCTCCQFLLNQIRVHPAVQQAVEKSEYIASLQEAHGLGPLALHHDEQAWPWAGDAPVSHPRPIMKAGVRANSAGAIASGSRPEKPAPEWTRHRKTMHAMPGIPNKKKDQNQQGQLDVKSLKDKGPFSGASSRRNISPPMMMDGKDGTSKQSKFRSPRDAGGKLGSGSHKSGQQSQVGSRSGGQSGPQPFITAAGASGMGAPSRGRQGNQNSASDPSALSFTEKKEYFARQGSPQGPPGDVTLGRGSSAPAACGHPQPVPRNVLTKQQSSTATHNQRPTGNSNASTTASNNRSTSSAATLTSNHNTSFSHKGAFPGNLPIATRGGVPNSASGNLGQQLNRQRPAPAREPPAPVTPTKGNTGFVSVTGRERSSSPTFLESQAGAALSSTPASNGVACR